MTDFGGHPVGTFCTLSVKGSPGITYGYRAVVFRFNEFGHWNRLGYSGAFANWELELIYDEDTYWVGFS